MDVASPRFPNRHVPRLILLTATCVLRGGWLWARFDDLQADVDGYRRLAISLIETGTYGFHVEDSDGRSGCVHPTAYRPPLYPLLLAGVGWVGRVPLFVVAAVHLLLGVATVAGVCAVARCWSLGNWAFVAGFLTACDPILLRQSSLVMTETAATALAVLALLALQRLDHRPTVISAALAGAVIALAVLCRPTFLVWFASIAVMLVLLPSLGIRERVKIVAAFVLVGCCFLSVWIGRNMAVLGHPVLATTHGGYTLLLGNNEGFYRYLETAGWGEIWDSSRLDARYNQVKVELGGDEVLADRWAYERAQSCIRQQPVSFLHACLVRAGRLWAVLPHRLSASESRAVGLQRYVVAVWYVLVFLLALWGLGRSGRCLCYRPQLWGLLLCLSFTVVHTFYWSNLRMRGPLMPVVCIFAAIGMHSLTAAIRALKRQSPDAKTVPAS